MILKKYKMKITFLLITYFSSGVCTNDVENKALDRTSAANVYANSQEVAEGALSSETKSTMSLAREEEHDKYARGDDLYRIMLIVKSLDTLVTNVYRERRLTSVCSLCGSALACGCSLVCAVRGYEERSEADYGTDCAINEKERSLHDRVRREVEVLMVRGCGKTEAGGVKETILEAMYLITSFILCLKGRTHDVALRQDEEEIVNGLTSTLDGRYNTRNAKNKIVHMADFMTKIRILDTKRDNVDVRRLVEDLLERIERKEVILCGYSCDTTNSDTTNSDSTNNDTTSNTSTNASNVVLEEKSKRETDLFYDFDDTTSTASTETLTRKVNDTSMLDESNHEVSSFELSNIDFSELDESNHEVSGFELSNDSGLELNSTTNELDESNHVPNLPEQNNDSGLELNSTTNELDESNHVPNLPEQNNDSGLVLNSTINELDESNHVPNLPEQNNDSGLELNASVLSQQTNNSSQLSNNATIHNVNTIESSVDEDETDTTNNRRGSTQRRRSLLTKEIPSVQNSLNRSGKSASGRQPCCRQKSPFYVDRLSGYETDSEGEAFCSLNHWEREETEKVVPYDLKVISENKKKTGGLMLNTYGIRIYNADETYIPKGPQQSVYKKRKKKKKYKSYVDMRYRHRVKEGKRLVKVLVGFIVTTMGVCIALVYIE